jgi:hypothetical protein
MTYLPNLTTMLRCALIISIITCTSAAPAAKPTAAAKPHRFKVGSAIFSGSAKTICVIEGKWADGELFRYEAWDECSEMRIRRVPEASYRGAPSLGASKDYTVADIPAKSEVLELSNGYSRVLLFRDRRGIMQEILSGD